MDEMMNGFYTSVYKNGVINILSFVGSLAAMMKVGYLICTNKEVFAKFTDPGKGLKFEVDGVEMALVPAVKLLG